MSISLNFEQTQPWILHYFSESDSDLSQSYGSPVGIDCPPKTITVEFDDDDEIDIDCTKGQQEARDLLLHEIRRRQDLEKSCNIARVICDTGIHVEPDHHRFWLMACANSRIVKTNLILQNGVGIIDPDYRGSVKFFYANLVPSEDISFLYHLSTSCGQLIPIDYHVQQVTFSKENTLEDLSETERGQGGFGSSTTEV